MTLTHVHAIIHLNIHIFKLNLTYLYTYHFNFPLYRQNWCTKLIKPVTSL